MCERTALTCREAGAILPAYLGGDLPVREREQVGEHLAGCAHCPTYFRQMALTSCLTKAAFDERDSSARPPESLVQSILAARRRASPRVPSPLRS